MQYEYDPAVDQLKEGRVGLEQYRALVERVTRQVANNQKNVSGLEARVKAYLQSGDRDTAANFALEMQKAKKELEDNEGQLKMHEQSYKTQAVFFASSARPLFFRAVGRCGRFGRKKPFLFQTGFRSPGKVV